MLKQIFFSPACKGFSLILSCCKFFIINWHRFWDRSEISKRPLMKISIFTLLICFPLFSMAQTNWEISGKGLAPSFYCYDIAAASGKVFACGTKSEGSSDDLPALFTSDDQGNSWQEVTMSGIPDVPGMIDISYTGKRLIASFGKYRKYGPMLSDDNGKTWRLPASGIDTINEWVYNTAVAGPSHIVALGRFIPTGSYILYNSTDTGNTWSKKTIFPPYGNLIDIKMIGDKLFAITDNIGTRIFTSHDLGATWKSIGGSFTSLNFMPDMISGDGRNLHVIGERGIYMEIYTSNDSGQTWQEHPWSVKDNLEVHSLFKAAHDNGVYYAVMYHKYAYKMFVSRDKLSVPGPDHKMLTVFPNPASKTFDVLLNTASAGSFTLLMYDINGKKVMEMLQLSKGTVHVNCSELVPGIYQLLLTGESREMYRSKVVLE
jgi:photosystem II stability/assembly factor-like uncharacterized protein